MACSWISAAFMMSQNRNHFPIGFLSFFLGVCAVNGLLYVVGGDDGSCNLSTVEYYNPTTDKWTVVSSCMSTGRSYAGNVDRFFFFFKTDFLQCNSYDKKFDKASKPSPV